ncbi:hypothetical protein [Deinococcus sp. DB0503]|uniref:hypothetical protein n=1 Tax=Deinococcus sp. DB0503 TaxID=2479203 RepID=UPI0018E037B5|nr:hypothetical protein [Deinococcus sp. DB0503]MBI0446983.1 hypothetical protein [Deinococcus sp. DB0503]
MHEDERAEVTAAFQGSDFRLTHCNLRFHQERFHAVGRADTPVAGVSVRFNTLAEARDLLWECPLHAAMPDVLSFALSRRVFDGAVLGGYADVRAHFRRTWVGIRRLDLLSLYREAGVRCEQRAQWLEGARAYVTAFWQTAGLGPGVENAAD